MEGQQHGEQLKRGLKNRHIQLIALGGAIGTGLFLGSASVIQSAGPGIILGYAIAGFIAFLIMRQLGEMVVEEPVAGSFSHFAYKYWGSFAGFASGWNYWVLYVLVAMAELTAVGKYIQFWYPEIPTWVSAAVFFVVINAINLTNVKVFGRMVTPLHAAFRGYVAPFPAGIRIATTLKSTRNQKPSSLLVRKRAWRI